LVWDRMGPEPGLGFTGPDRWRYRSLQKANDQINPHYGTNEQLNRKFQEYLDLSLEMLQWGQVKPEFIEDKQTGKQFLIFGADPKVGQTMQLLATELMKWFRAQPNTRQLIDWPARVGLATMLTQRTDLAMLL